MRLSSCLMATVSALVALASCQPRQFSEVSSAAKPKPGECPSPDPLAIPGVNTKTGKCVDLTQFRVANHLEGNREGGYLAASASYNAFAAAHGFKTNVSKFQRYPMVANVKHEGKFWIAQLDLENVQKAYFQVEEFKMAIPKEKLQSDPALEKLFNGAMVLAEKEIPNLQPEQLRNDVQAAVSKARATGEYTAAHGQFRIDFKAPIPLALQSNPKIRTTIKSAVLSVHAVAEKYDPVAGLQGEYPLALGVFSAQEKFEGSVLKAKNNFRQYQVNIAGDDLVEFVNLYLKNAPQIFRTRDYNTFDANCGNVLFETAESAFFAKKHPEIMAQMKQHSAASFGRGYPKYAQYALQAYGWLVYPDQLKGEPWVSLP
jgi:hypothetical protein